MLFKMKPHFVYGHSKMISLSFVLTDDILYVCALSATHRRIQWGRQLQFLGELHISRARVA